MATHIFDLTDTRNPSNPLPIWTLTFDDVSKQLSIDCSTSIHIPSTPANGESVLLGLLKDLEVGAINKIYDPDSPISEPDTFDNPDFTAANNFQFRVRTDNEEAAAATVTETQTAYAFKFLGWFKANPPSASDAVNDDD